MKSQIRQRPDPAKNFKLVIQILMSVAYLGSGIFLYFHPSGSKMVPPEYITILSVALLVYGLFRLFRAYLQHRSFH